jgi:hypothetical protein
VTFVGDDLQTTLPITYDTEKVTIGKTYNIVLNLDNASNYGAAQQNIAFTVVAPTVTEVWDGSVPEGTDAAGNTYPAVQGTCTGTGNYLYEAAELGDDPGLPIYKVYDPENPHSYELVIEHWGYNKPFTITVPDDRVRNSNGEVIVRVYSNDFGYDLVSDLVGATAGTYGTTYVSDAQYYLGDLRGKEVDYADYSTFNPETGVFSMYVAYFCTAGYVALDYDYFNLDGYPDYTVTVDYTGLYTNPSQEVFAIGTTSTGANVASVKAALVETKSSDAAVSYVLEGGSDVKDVAAGTDVRTLFPVSTSGTYYIAAVSYDAAGTAHKAAYVKVEIELGSTDDSADWDDLGTGQYIDGVFLPGFLNDYTTYSNYAIDVPIRQNKSDKNTYQVVEPYGASYALTKANYNACTKTRNINISAIPLGSDTYYVALREQNSGFLYEKISSNELTIGNYEGMLVDYGSVDTEDVDQMTYVVESYLPGKSVDAATFDGEIITLPCVFYMFDTESMYLMKNYQPTYVILPTASSATRKKVAAKSVANPKFIGLTSSIAAKKAADFSKKIAYIKTAQPTELTKGTLTIKK